MRQTRQRYCQMRRSATVVLLLLGFTSVPCISQTQKLSAHDLVDRAMRAQIAAQSDSSRFDYFQTQLEKRQTRTYRMIESDAGSVQRLVAINGETLNPKQRDSEIQNLENLLRHPTVQRERQEEDSYEDARRQKIISVLGKAFLYEIESRENEGPIVRLHFKPDPNFRADSREAKVCAGLEGTMWIDSLNGRFVRAEGTLVRPVDFGWGLFGHLNEGGHFGIEQNEIDPGVWRITKLDVSFKGRVLIFKGLDIRVQEHSFNFHRIAENLSLSDAVEMLRQDVVVPSEQ